VVCGKGERAASVVRAILGLHHRKLCFLRGSYYYRGFSWLFVDIVHRWNTQSFTKELEELTLPNNDAIRTKKIFRNHMALSCGSCGTHSQ
jgi:hypothetical protein